ncbi:hypothetical protein BTH42_05510 [Burkholderia sp. SRS-W-2-2016]|uniref:Csu type fimbrial protein n=1 Tax=Burkholderia sp. SRS-W-2-2016 TaxID=1926878 RepID=UPI00094AE79C|nr:spore coat U domain-containing protein [Burkholderia sp. SRS-W-2-2016]OLL32712.1 hypothetical protein BTH42_05510 [Burkholderia sp. SRS-W-2-2016]
MKTSRLLSFAAVAALLAATVQHAQAASVAGQINATITLVASCQIDNASSTSGGDVEFGTLDFGDQSAVFTSASAQVMGNASSGIGVRCSPGANATLSILSGAHDAQAGVGTHAMANGTHYIPYSIYTDAGHANVLANGAAVAITADGTTQNVALYGLAFGASGIVAGLYTDTLRLELSF